MDLDRLISGLDSLERKTEAEWEATPAAVLIPLFLDDERWHLLFTRRTESVDVHRGEVSFPGGRLDDTDSGPVEAALREAEEEIGLAPRDVEILGQLNPILTVSQFHLTPVVGRIPWPYEFELNGAEVDRAFGVPVDWLADPAHLTVEHRQLPVPGRPIEVYYFDSYEDEVIWGVTARIIVKLLELLRS